MSVYSSSSSLYICDIPSDSDSFVDSKSETSIQNYFLPSDPYEREEYIVRNSVDYQESTRRLNPADKDSIKSKVRRHHWNRFSFQVNLALYPSGYEIKFITKPVGFETPDDFIRKLGQEGINDPQLEIVIKVNARLCLGVRGFVHCDYFEDGQNVVEFMITSVKDNDPPNVVSVYCGRRKVFMSDRTLLAEWTSLFRGKITLLADRNGHKLEEGLFESIAKAVVENDKITFVCVSVDSRDPEDLSISLFKKFLLYFSHSCKRTSCVTLIREVVDVLTEEYTQEKVEVLPRLNPQRLAKKACDKWRYYYQLRLTQQAIVVPFSCYPPHLQQRAIAFWMNV